MWQAGIPINLQRGTKYSLTSWSNEPKPSVTLSSWNNMGECGMYQFSSGQGEVVGFS
jgi:hypothetical protein